MIRFTRMLATGVLTLVLAASAWAGPLGGYGELEAKDVASATVRISGKSYVVTDKTVMRDREGVATDIEALPAPTLEELAGLTPVIGARFEAQEIRGQLVLLTLDVVPALD